MKMENVEKVILLAEQRKQLKEAVERVSVMVQPVSGEDTICLSGIQFQSGYTAHLNTSSINKIGPEIAAQVAVFTLELLKKALDEVDSTLLAADHALKYQ